MALRKQYVALARALEAAYPKKLAPQESGGQWSPGLFSVDDLLALPGVPEAAQDRLQLAHMLRVISEFSPRVWFGHGLLVEGPLSVGAFTPPPYWLPGRQFRLYPPDDYRASLLVETHIELDDGEVSEAKLRMAGIGCQFGLLFDVHRTLVLRDSLQGEDPLLAVELAHELSTAEVLSRFAPVTRASLDHDVEIWLKKLTTGWVEAISKQAERNVLDGILEDVAPAAFGAEIVPNSLAA